MLISIQVLYGGLSFIPVTGSSLRSVPWEELLVFIVCLEMESWMGNVLDWRGNRLGRTRQKEWFDIWISILTTSVSFLVHINAINVLYCSSTFDANYS
jgi:hypothetical protein